MMWFSLAAALSAVWLGVHLVLGGKDIAAPLLRADGLVPVVRDTQYLCWHFTSCAIAAMAVGFAYAAWSGDIALAWGVTLLAAAFAVTGIGLVIRIGQSHRKLPQGWLFVPVATFGAIGLFQV
ncbi:hypothetical protein [Marivita hallyeonensis]|uniref:DUF423 domain-containing protein n=1 Tax=Marivita hallyeonensis TaxID=996342 RepID=A0A1M5TE42_9RHOB|nr:hypothetical protein [Marivita hallyeonensis]SHH48900.1 hypothetical protein SAMN05443551_2189 [Marivita hallyeonensis]